MGKIVNGYILPHPPIIVPEVGQGREEDAAKTISAVKRAAREIAWDKPTTIILSSPHAPSFRDFVYISNLEFLSGNFRAFGCQTLELNFENNRDLFTLIIKQAELAGINAGGLSSRIKEKYGILDMLDHGALVPLYFIKKELPKFRLVHISTPFMPLPEIYKFGKCLGEAVALTQENVVYVASGDLSHRLTADAPSGYHPRGLEYDQYLISKLEGTAVAELIRTDENFMEIAGECGTRSFIMMLGALDGYKLKTDVFSYEGPFGVGYLVAKVNVLGKEEGKDIISASRHDKQIEPAEMRKKESDYVRLARETLEAYVKEHKSLSMPRDLSPELLNKRAGVFVSIKKNGQLRGCIGTISPVQKNIAEEIMHNAISSGTEDPRFQPVKEDELAELVYSVDVLGEPEKIDSLQDLDVKRYGVIVSSGLYRGLLLPDLEGVDTPQQQVAIARQKAGISDSEEFKLERFEVIRYK
ncbi:MAG TPA: AmmeMemoRadiSam system protein A [Desulfitobacteriaceae bacterium]|nr:AmmeMemoRadiSam system protein A [Desulfitobacteriaceae bacterium]